MMHFTCIIISFDLYEVGLDPSFYRWGRWGSERPCLWPKGSWLIGGMKSWLLFIITAVLAFAWLWYAWTSVTKFKKIALAAPPTIWFKFHWPQHIKCEWLHKVQTLLLALQFPDHYVNHWCASRSVTRHVTSFQVCWWLVTEHLPFSRHTDSWACSCVPSLSLRHFTQIDNKKKELANKDESAVQQRNEEVKLEMRFESSFNGVCHWGTSGVGLLQRNRNNRWYMRYICIHMRYMYIYTYISVMHRYDILPIDR